MAYQPKFENDDDHGRTSVENVQAISPNRPPNRNEENISSSEAGTSQNDPSSAVQRYGFGVEMTRDISLLYPAGHVSSSYASSAADSIRCPDGPERKGPAKEFTPVGPAEGLGELRHRRTALLDEIEDDFNNAISLWVPTLRTNGLSFESSSRDISHHSLRLDPRIRFPHESVQATRGSKTTSLSPSSCCTWGSVGMYGSDFDLAGLGGWDTIDEGWDGYPMEIEGEVNERKANHQ